MTSLFPQSEQLPRASEHWFLTRDGDPYGFEISRRHYSARHYQDNRLHRLFVGPGRKLVLLSADGAALFVWRYFIDDTQPKQEGFSCALFRNESDCLSSTLIREAVEVVFKQWGENRCYTLVNPAKIRSTNPGCCFLKAGWRRCAVSKTGKTILELLP